MEIKTNNSINTSQKRNSSLDVIRAVALFLVMFNHVHLMEKEEAKGLFKYIRLLFTPGAKGGWVGVDLFFVLSGFLVSGLLFSEYKRTSSISAKSFLIRRGFKIYPSFFFFIVIAFIIERYFLSLHYPLNLYIKDLLFLNNYFGGRFGHTWTLDVEEFFYFAFAAYFLFLLKFSRLNLKILCTTYFFLVIIGILGRLYNNITHPELNFTLHYNLTHFRLESLFFGVILSYIYHYHREKLYQFVEKWKAFLLYPALILIFIPFIINRVDNNWISVILLSVLPVSLGIPIIIAVNANNKLTRNTFLSYIGKYSYGIYLWHLPLASWIYSKKFMSNTTWVAESLTYFIFSIISGILMTKLIEVPFLRLRDKLFPSRAILINNPGS